MFLGESGHFHFLSFGILVILNSSSCQSNATDEGAIALKALDFQINAKIVTATLILVDRRGNQ